MSAMEIHILSNLIHKHNTHIISHTLYKYELVTILLPAVVVKVFVKNIYQIYNKT